MITEENVLFVLEKAVGTDQVRKDIDIHLFEEGLLDSLGFIELIVALSEKCNVDIQLAEVEREAWSTPRKIIEVLQARAQG